MAIEVQHADGRVELSDNLNIERSPLYNHDLAPVRVKDRNWSTYNFAALWISMAHQSRAAVMTSTKGAAQFSTCLKRFIPR